MAQLRKRTTNQCHLVMAMLALISAGQVSPTSQLQVGAMATPAAAGHASSPPPSFQMGHQQAEGPTSPTHAPAKLPNLFEAKTQLELPPTKSEQVQQQQQQPQPQPQPQQTQQPQAEEAPPIQQTQRATLPQPASASSRAPVPASSQRNLIEKILIQAEDLNLEEQHWRLKAEARPRHNQSEPTSSALGDDGPQVDEDEGRAEPLGASSQAPTDSGEDPLESATTVASSSREADSGRPQAASENGPGAGQASGASGASGHQATLLDDEQRLVDSNNVSALLSASSSSLNSDSANNQKFAHQSPPAAEWRPDVVTMASKQTSTCEQAYTQCALRKVCEPALRAYNDDCQDLINNRTSQCSAKCLKAMIALRSSEEGDELMACDCQGDEYCIQSKRRSEACRPEVERAVHPSTIVSCSIASWICMADQLCSTALDYYYRNCQSLFSQRYCTLHCNNSLAILYRQPRANKLINCQCDGSEEFPCVKYKTYTERLCLNKQTTTPTIVGQTDAANSGDQQTQMANEDDNLTSDPEHLPSFQFGPSLSSSAGANTNEELDNNDEEYETGAEESTAANFNGIQFVEDNWIPIMSGRYFSLLHQQQQQQQREEQRQRQPSSSRDQNVPRGTQKKPKQKTKSNQKSQNHDVRRRSGHRLYAAASTTSSGSSKTNLIGSHRASLSAFSSMVVALVFAVFNIVLGRRR